MNEFEKWVEYYSRDGFTEKEKHYCKRAYQAALKWVGKRITKRLKMASMDDNVACVKHIEDDIEEELGITSRSTDREIVEIMHGTHIGK